ncbi:CarD family transcriptional regulator [Microvirga massiliensis]|uniref:CarD family transcriptional regulator n=1 Tax=Microvirga massiliensis TaxID=1033741 RepID=UPI00062BA080|nr:CarD family transcriptional regulator [Microvirga massiliensis]
MTTAKKAAPAPRFKVGEAVVYPSRGVGRITAIEEQEVAGFKLEMFVISFDKEKAVLKVPTERAAKQGLRKVADAAGIDAALATLSGRARSKRGMWSRRAIELEAKIASGDISTIAEVVRDLHRGEGQADASFSERGLYEAALSFLVSEISASKDISETETLRLIEAALAKSPRPAAKALVAPDDDDIEDQVA